MQVIFGLAGWLRRYPLAVFLPLQAGLLFYHLELLPVWGDEQFTLDAVARPWSEIPALLSSDIHPPGYFLLTRLWLQAPWPGSPLSQVRAFSAFWGLLSTLLIYFLWSGRLGPSARIWFLALWTLSPPLVLYSRMARSYSLQLFFALLLIYVAVKFVSYPQSTPWQLAYASAAALLLYVHYLPGAAIVLSTSIIFLLRWRRQRPGYCLRPLLLVTLAVGMVYLPWAKVFGEALLRVARAEPYRLTSGSALDALTRVIYWFTSFTFGESFPLWAVVLSAALTPAIIWLLWRGLRCDRDARLGSSVPVVGLAAVIGYAGAASWVAFAFTPARLLFLLPFYLLWIVRGKERTPKAGMVVCAGLVVVWASALSSYFHQTGFLNKGYLIPFSEIAAQVRADSTAAHTLVVIDPDDADPKPLLAELGDTYPCVIARDGIAEQVIQQRARDDNTEVVWYLHADDVSPQGGHRRLETELAGVFESRRHSYLPYSTLDRLVLRLLGRRNVPTYRYQMLEFRRLSLKTAQRDAAIRKAGPFVSVAPPK